MKENGKNTILIVIASLALIISFVIGGIFIVKGLDLQQSKAKNLIQNTAKDITEIATSTTENNDSSVTDIQNEITKIEEQIKQKENECISLDLKSQTWLEDHTKCEKEVLDLRNEKTELENKLFNIQNTAKEIADKASKGIDEIYDIAKKQTAQNSMIKNAEIFNIITGCVIIAIGVIVFAMLLIMVIKNKKTGA